MPTPPSPSANSQVSAADPWGEQASRRSAHRRRRRRRWARSAAALVGVVGVGAGAWSVFDWASTSGSGREPATLASGAPPSTAPATTTTGPAATTTSIDPRTLVELAEVWLLDREDGAFDWGVVVASTGAVDRGDVTVTARLYDPTGAIVEIVGDEIGLLPAGARAAAGGVVRDLPRAPSRIEVDVAVGRPIDGSVGGSLAARAVERRVDARAGSDVLIGRIVSRLDSDVASVRLAAIWRDEDGAVVAAVFDDIERVRPGVDARFEIPLDGLVVPDGPPDEVLLARPAP